MTQTIVIFALATTFASWAAIVVSGPRTPEEREYEDNLQSAYLASLSKNKQRK